MSNNPPCPPFTPLPPPNQLDLKVHTAQDGSQWVNNGGQWVRYDTHPSLQQMDVDSLRPVGNLHQFAPPPAPGIQDHRAPEQYNFSIRSISSAPPYASSSHIPIDPRLIPLPHGNDHDLTDPAAIANAKGLKPAKKVAGARHIDKDPKGKKRRLDSDSEDDRPTNKRGRPSGSQNFSAADKKALFDPVQQELPLGGKGWKAVHQIYDTYRRANNRAKRSVSSLETKYKGYLKLKKPTGDGICPPEVKRVYEIEALINERAGTRELNDSDIDDLASSAGSSDNDDEIQVIDKPEVRTAVAQRARTPPLHRQRRGAPELVDKLTRAFDPEVQKARDEDRYQRAAQNTQLFTLSQQLRDSHTSAESLRNQLTIMQQHLNDAERSRDVALLKLEMMDYRGNQGDRGSDYRNSRGRSPRRRSPSPRKIRYEARYSDGGACTYFEDVDERPLHHRLEEDPLRRRSPLRTQIYYPSSPPATSPCRPAPSAGPSHRQRSPSPTRPVTPLMRGSTANHDGPSVIGSGVEVTVTPTRPGGVPLSLIISAPKNGER